MEPEEDFSTELLEEFVKMYKKGKFSTSKNSLWASWVFLNFIYIYLVPVMEAL